MSISVSRRGLARLVVPLAAVGVVLPASHAAAEQCEDVEDSQHFFPIPDGVNRVGLVVFLDGDGQELHNTDSAVDSRQGGLFGGDGVVGVAHSRGYDVLSVRSPRSRRWWTDDTKANQVSNAPLPGGLTISEKICYLTKVIEEVRTGRGAVVENLWLVGYSGGSEFITEFFFPAYANRMKEGGFLVFGGGDVASGGLKADVFNQNSLDNLSLNWVTGEQDVPSDPKSGGSPDDFDGIGHATSGCGYYSDVFTDVRCEWPAHHDHESIVRDFGKYLGLALDGKIPEAPKAEDRAALG